MERIGLCREGEEKLSGGRYLYHVARAQVLSEGTAQNRRNGMATSESATKESQPPNVPSERFSLNFG